MKPSPESDITGDPEWQFQQMDRLLGWEMLQNSLGRGKAETTERALADRLAMPTGFWHVMIRKIKRRLADAEK